MSEITDRMPTTDDVRDAYIESAFEGYEQEAAEAFDRWLAVHDAERDLAKAWYEGWCAGERWGYWVEREDPINHQDVSMSANPHGDYTPPENERESNWPIDA